MLLTYVWTLKQCLMLSELPFEKEIAKISFLDDRTAGQTETAYRKRTETDDKEEDLEELGVPSLTMNNSSSSSSNISSSSSSPTTTTTTHTTATTTAPTTAPTTTTEEWHAYCADVEKWKQSRSVVPGSFASDKSELCYEQSRAVQLPAVSLIPWLQLPLRVHLVRGIELGCTLSADALRSTVMGVTNSLWE
jgi:uncharacterized membrane protein